MSDESVYRVPVAFRIPTDWSTERIAEAFAGAIRHVPTLQVSYGYSIETGDFRQHFAPIADDDLVIPTLHVDITVDAFCASDAIKPDIKSSYPWRAAIVESSSGRHLCVEFHHICIDGVGVRLFEKYLYGEQPHIPTADPQRGFDMYETVAQRENSAFAATSEPFRRSRNSERHEGPVLARRRTRISDEQRADVTAWAKSSGVTVRSVYQAAFELAFASVWSPANYASVSNWRWNLDRDVVGAFPALLAQQPSSGESLGVRAQHIFRSQFDPRIKAETEFAFNPAVVFSFEQFDYAFAEFIAVDMYPKFDLYVRVSHSASASLVEIETDRRYIGDADLNLLIDVMAQQLGHAVGVK